MIKKNLRKILSEISYFNGKYLTPPLFISLVITFKCNFCCQSCDIWKKNIQEITDNDWLIIAEKIKFLPKNTFIEINGGEPLLKKELVVRLVKKLKEHFQSVTLNTNSSLLDEKIIDELEKAGLDTIKMSLYSLEKEIHNQMRGNNVAFDGAIKALELIQKSKIKLEIGILLTKKNISSAPILIEHLNNFQNISIILQPLDEKIESTISRDMNQNLLDKDLWPEDNQVRKFFSWIHGKKNLKIKNSANNLKAIEKYYLDARSVLNYRCFAGQRSLIFYPDGNVSLCFKRKSIGNALDNNIPNLLRKAKEERKDIKNCKKYCRIVGCNFSRGIKEFLRDKIATYFITSMFS